MADRYWIAIAGDYTGSWLSTTNWSTSAVGSGGASVPTSSDNVFFNFTSLSMDTDITIDGAASCLNLNITGTNSGFALRFYALGTPSLNIYGTVSCSVGMVCEPPVTFLSTASQTLTPNGLSFAPGGVTFSGSGSYWTLGASMLGSPLILGSGVTLDTSSSGNYGISFNATTINSSAVLKLNASTASGLGVLSVLSGGTLNMGSSSCTFFSFSVASGGTLNMGSATVTISNDTPFTITSGATFTPTTGTITLSGSNCSFSGFGYTYNTLTFTSSAGAININNTGGIFNAININGSSSITIASNNTVNGAVTITGSPISSLTINSGNTFNGTVSLNGTTLTTVSLNSSAFAAFTVASAVTTFTTNGSNTFGNVNFNKVPATTTFNGANTYSSLTFSQRTSVGVSQIIFGNNQTVSGAFSTTAGTTPAYRVFISSDSLGVTRTLSAASSSLNNVDFQDIAATGGAAFSGTSIGDVAGNSGITFTAAVTRYWRGTASAQWDATTSWSATSGGTASSTAFPLAQDTAIFPAATYPTSGATVTIGYPYNIGTIDMSLRTTNTMVLALGTQNPNFVGDFKFGTGSTITSTGTPVFCGRNTQQILTAGKSFATALSINSPGGTVVLLDSCSVTRATSPIVLSAGTINLNGNTLSTTSTTSTSFLVNATSSPKNITFNGGGLTLSSTTNPFTNVGTNFTTTAGTGTGNISVINGGTFSTLDATFNCTLNLAGSAALTITGSSTFNDITNTYKTVGATSIKFTAGTTTTFTNFNLQGTSANRCTLASTSTVPANLKKSSTWYMGANSTNVAGNTNLVFTAGGGADYLNVSYINGIVASGAGNSNFFAFF